MLNENIFNIFYYTVLIGIAIILLYSKIKIHMSKQEKQHIRMCSKTFVNKNRKLRCKAIANENSIYCIKHKQRKEKI